MAWTFFVLHATPKILLMQFFIFSKCRTLGLEIFLIFFFIYRHYLIDILVFYYFWIAVEWVLPFLLHYFDDFRCHKWGIQESKFKSKHKRKGKKNKNLNQSTREMETSQRNMTKQNKWTHPIPFSASLERHMVGEKILTERELRVSAVKGECLACLGA